MSQGPRHITRGDIIKDHEYQHRTAVHIPYAETEAYAQCNMIKKNHGMKFNMIMQIRRKITEMSSEEDE